MQYTRQYARTEEGSQVCIPVLTPDRTNKRQNGRRFKEDGDPQFTLTSQDRHGVAIGLTVVAYNTTKNSLHRQTDIATTLLARDYKGLANHMKKTVAMYLIQNDSEEK